MGLIQVPGQPQLPENMPEGLHDSLMLLLLGIEKRSLVVMRRKMDDGDDTEAYDLAVAIPHELTREVRFFPIARMIPQHPKELPKDEPTSGIVSAPDPID
jgi:hypothetical protein